MRRALVLEVGGFYDNVADNLNLSTFFFLRDFLGANSCWLSHNFHVSTCYTPSGLQFVYQATYCFPV